MFLTMENSVVLRCIVRQLGRSFYKTNLVVFVFTVIKMRPTLIIKNQEISVVDYILLGI